MPASLIKKLRKKIEKDKKSIAQKNSGAQKAAPEKAPKIPKTNYEQTTNDIYYINLITKALAYLVVAIIIISGTKYIAQKIIHSETFAVADVQVHGDTAHNSAASLQANILPHLAGNFLTMDLAKAKQAFEQAPWVRTAHIRRVFPNQLIVTLKEHELVAMWGESGETLINNHGEIFDSAGDLTAKQQNLPVLEGSEEDAKQILKTYQELSLLIEQIGEKITKLQQTKQASWILELTNGMKIKIGQGQTKELASRLQNFIASINTITQRHKKELKDIQIADLRYKNGYAIDIKQKIKED